MLTENKKLDAKIQKVRELKRQTDAITKQIRKSAIREIKQYMERYEITLEDLGATLKDKPAAPAAAAADPKKGRKNVIKPKYRSDDGKFTWTGRGLQPKWLTKAISEGRKIEEFLIEKP